MTKTPESCSKCCEIDQISASISNLTILHNDQTIVLSRLETGLVRLEGALVAQKSTIDGLTASQTKVQGSINAHGLTLDNLKASSDQLTTTLTDLKTNIDATFEEKLSLFDEKLEILDEKLINSESRNGRKIDEIKKELDGARYKILVSMDSKLKAIENRLMEKVENLDEKLDEKLGKIFKALDIKD